MNLITFLGLILLTVFGFAVGVYFPDNLKIMIIGLAGLFAIMFLSAFIFPNSGSSSGNLGMALIGMFVGVPCFLFGLGTAVGWLTSYCLR